MSHISVRVYGVLFNEKHQLLVADELIRGGRYTKFPGGGLEFGEGTRACLVREFMEELHLKVEVLEHLYTTDFFQESAFRPGDQILSIYYRVKALEPITARISQTPFDFLPEQMELYQTCNEIEAFRFLDWDGVTEDSVTLPIDKVLVRLLKERCKQPE